MNSALEHYERGMQFWQNKQSEAAITELIVSLELDPNYRMAVFNLACVYGALDRYEEAIEKFQLLIRRDQNDATTYKYMGKLLRQKAQSSANREDWDTAQEALQQSLTLNPNDADALDELAIVLYELGDFGDAIQTSMAAAAIAPKDHRISHNVGAIGGKILRKCISKGKWKEAWQLWRMTFNAQQGK